LTRSSSPILALIVSLGLTQSSVSLAQSQTVKASYVALGHGVPGVLYEPSNPGPKSQVALFVMHASGDYLNFSACTELAHRGYRVLCANNSTSKSGASDEGALDKVLSEAKLAIVYLKDYPGVKKVILFGHSGGATLMTAYQLIAEGGVKACQGREKIHRCPDGLAGLPAADGVVLADANWGQAEMTLFSIDPAVVREDTGMLLNVDLDMYSPKNGASPSGSNYSADFVKKFLKAEGARNNKLIETAQNRLSLIQGGKGLYDDDEPFIVPGASFVDNKLFSQDVRLLSHSLRAWPLVHADGSVTVTVIHSVRKADSRENPTPSMMRGALKTTVRNFLSSYAIRTTSDFGYGEDSIRGIEWASTYASPPGNVEGITVPLLALGMTGHWEGLAAETIYDHAKSVDKSIAFVEGAGHMYTPCKECEKEPGQFGDTVKLTYDYVDAWLSKPGRFLTAGAAEHSI
jgi:hypothetical protein